LQGAALRSIASDRPQIPETEEDPEFDKALAEPQFGNPLVLVMAGVIALDHGAPSGTGIAPFGGGATARAARAGPVCGFGPEPGVSSNTMRHIVAFNELADGIPISELRTSVADELAASERSADVDLLLALLEQELPPRTGSGEAASGQRLATIQPDLIGEAAIIELKRLPASDRANWKPTTPTHSKMRSPRSRKRRRPAG